MGRPKPTRIYVVTEQVMQFVNYDVVASTKEEARQIVEAGDAIISGCSDPSPGPITAIEWDREATEKHRAMLAGSG